MITLVTNVIKFCMDLVRSIIIVFSTVGQAIVFITTGVTSIILTIFENIFTFFKIVYEDNIFIITEQLPNLSNSFTCIFYDQWQKIEDNIGATYINICTNLNSVINTTHWCFYAVYTVIAEVLLIFKKALILFGNTTWLLLTFIPVHLPLVLREFWIKITDYMINTIVEIYMLLLRMTNFLTDVPLESFIGISSAIIIVRLCVHFREYINVFANALYWSVVRKLLYFYYVLYNYFVDSEVRVIAHIAGNQPLQMREMVAEAIGEEEEIVNPADTLCVVCQERQKCVLTLPCRHVCLCRDCCTRLYSYQRTCPICRTFIYHSVNIYL